MVKKLPGRCASAVLSFARGGRGAAGGAEARSVTQSGSDAARQGLVSQGRLAFTKLRGRAVRVMRQACSLTEKPRTAILRGNARKLCPARTERTFPIVGFLRCLKRYWPSPRQANRSDTPCSATPCSTHARRSAGLRSFAISDRRFPLRSLSKSASRSSDLRRPCEYDYSQPQAL